MERILNPGDLNRRLTLITNKVVGNEIVPQTIDVWGEKASITRNEFTALYQLGLNPQVLFKIRPSAYELSSCTDEDGTKRYASMIKFKGTTYNIIRTYEIEDELIEITCS